MSNCNENESFQIVIRDLEVGELLKEGYQPITIKTSRGDIECRYYKVANTRCGAIWVGGVQDGWDTPAQGLYPNLCQKLQSQAIASLRVRFRHSTILAEAVCDVLTGISYLLSEGIEVIALTGHSFGGAVVIQAAAICPAVRSVVTLATQSHGAVASLLPPECAILMLHGTVDQVLTPACSEYVYCVAHEPKQIILYPDANHNLDEVATEVDQVVYDWILEKLNK